MERQEQTLDPSPAAAVSKAKRRRWSLLCLGMVLCAMAYFTYSYHHLWFAELAQWRGDGAAARRHARAHLRTHPHSARADNLLEANVDRRAAASQRYTKSDGSDPPPPVETGPKLNQPAPEFALKTLQEQEVRLAERRAQRPVLLHFGSYSCPLFRADVDGIAGLHREFGRQVDFYTVYLRENHPFDPGVQQQLPPMFSVRIKQHQTYQERCAAAARCAEELGLQIPVLVDQMGDAIGEAYAAQPTRVYLIGTDGTIAYKSSASGLVGGAAAVRKAILALLADSSEQADTAP